MNKPVCCLREPTNWGGVIQRKVTMATCVQNVNKASGEEKVSIHELFHFLDQFKCSKC